MNTIVVWLLEMETIAGNFYREAAEAFRKDSNLSVFLNTLANDEDLHRELMAKALTCVEDAKFTPPVTLDAETGSKLRRLFTNGLERIATGEFTKDELFDCIIEAEFSEWNPVFAYTVNYLVENVAECFNIGPAVQVHEKYIKRFIEMNPDFLHHLEKLTTLPVIWKDTILIVDDEPVILKLLRDLFDAQWYVETAKDGREALDKLRYGYFDVIVSDINMRPMDGITFYREAKKLWPDVGERFLFYTGNIDQYSTFFKEHNLSFMMKPSTIKQLRTAVLNIAHTAVVRRVSELS